MRKTRVHNKLTTVSVKAKKEPGLYADGGNLYLQITEAGVKSWLFRYMLNGKARGMGLGPFHTVTLAEARLKAQQCRKLLLDGVDPLDAKRDQPPTRHSEIDGTVTFKQCAETFIEKHKVGWKNAKHAEQWASTLKTYAYPVIGDMLVAAVGLPHIQKILDPIWTTKNETASRLRGRIEQILDMAAVAGYRTGDNPARWKGHLDKLLARPSKVQKVQHHAALPYRDIATFISKLGDQEGIARFALEFLILTAARTGEVIEATWDEFDLPAGKWTIPAGRMKAAKEHNVALSDRAIEIVKQMKEVALHQYVFPGQRDKKPLSNMAMLQLLKRMDYKDLTAHGFRSTFRDWAGECTNHPREVVEAALAHQLKDKAEAAYARGDLFVKRSRLMADWASYCSTSAKTSE